MSDYYTHNGVVYWGSPPRVLARDHLSRPSYYSPASWSADGSKKPEIWALVRWGTADKRVEYHTWYILLRGEEPARVVSTESGTMSPPTVVKWPWTSTGSGGRLSSDDFWFDDTRVLAGWYNRTTGEIALYAGAQ